MKRRITALFFGLALVPGTSLLGQEGNASLPPPAPVAGTSDQLLTTGQAYRQALVRQVVNQPNVRWQRMVETVLQAPNPPPDGKFIGIGRGEVAYVLPLALAASVAATTGYGAEAPRLTDGALRTLRVCNRVAVDHYYADNEDGEGGNLGQISFVLPEVVQACRVLQAMGALTGEDLARTRTMVEAVVQHRMRIMPDIGMGGMSNWINRGGLGPLRAAHFLEQAWKTDPAFAKARPDLPSIIARMRTFGVLPLTCGSDFPYLFRTQPDGTMSAAIRVEGRPAVESPAPAGRTPQFGINEDSSGYGADSVGNLLHLIQEAPADLVPELDAGRMQQLCGWLQNWRAMLLPGGPMPSYGDSHWTGLLGWAAVFETAAGQFGDGERYGPAAADFRAAAAQIFRYVTTCSSADAEDLAHLVASSTSQVEPAALPQGSRIISLQNARGDLQPAKIVLRGGGARPEDDAYALLQTFAGSSHSHADFGCLIAYSRGRSVFVHESGYDAGDMQFHQLPLVGASDAPLLPFHVVNDGSSDPKGTEVRKGNKGLPGGFRRFESATLDDQAAYAVARITTTFKMKIDGESLQVRFIRQALLEKQTGILIVYDAVSNENGYQKPFKFSPIWHVQHVLERTPQGFLCQDDCQNILSPDAKAPVKVGTPSGPLWIGMAGPTGAVPSVLSWRFLTKGRRTELPQGEHLWMENVVSLGKGDTTAVVTVLVPMDGDRPAIKDPPALATIAGANATVTVAGRPYVFTPSGVTTGF